MTLEETGLTEEQVMAVRDRPLEESYKTHDIGMVHLRQRLNAHGFTVEEHGDDARHADEVLYGDGPDLKVYDDGELVAYIELKVKTSPEWFARCNRRHYNEYVNFTNEVDEPVFIWFALVDAETEQLHRSAFFEVEDTDQIDGRVVDVTDQSMVFPSDATQPVEGGPDGTQYVAVDADDIAGVRPGDVIVDQIPSVHGNQVVCLNEDDLRSMPHFLSVVS
jgi:hypothetical protein